MKLTFNMTTSQEDLSRYRDREDFLSALEGFDGVELMYLGEDERGIVPPERIVGWHMGYFPCWVDFFRGDTAALTREFGTRERWEEYYGGADKSALMAFFRREMERAEACGARYAVLHVGEATVEETFTLAYRHSDEEVIDATAELVNSILPQGDGSVALLLENLWQPGLTFTRPEMTARLMEGISYKNKGIMLDTGHLFHTDTSIRTEEEGLEYIHRMLDIHGPLCAFIRGVHLHQSITGQYMERMRACPPVLNQDYGQRQFQMFTHAFAVDGHKPFTAPGVKALIDRIAPEFLTLEYISESRAQHEEYLAAGRRAIGLGG